MLHPIVEQWWSWIVPLSWQLAIWIALVAGVVWLARNASPQVRYVLWTLVLVKVFLPPSLAVNWGFGHWGLKPAWESVTLATEIETTARSAHRELETESVPVQQAAAEKPTGTSARTMLFGVWLLGTICFGATTLFQYLRLLRQTREMNPIDEGPVRVALERLAMQARLQRVPELFASSETASPYLFGLTRPRIVLPHALIENLPPKDLEGVLLHELCHYRRGDLWVGALQAVVQSILWFHPLVWWANARLRQERECACDQDVLSQTDVSPADYGQTLLSVLSVAKGRALYQANLVGVFEPGANVQQRLEEIMKEQPRTGTSALWYFAMASLMFVFLPMAAVKSAAQNTSSVAKEPAAEAMPAWIVETSPAIGATDVDPELKEITVTFDRDMGGGMSWTGQDYLPPNDPTRKTHWRDKRTCVLPVQLKKGEFYRVGINSTNFLNFKSADGQPCPCTAICFATQGASKAIAARVRVPKIVKMIPENGANDVSPSVKALRVTFDVPMGEGMSWTGGGEQFPKIADGEKAKWSGDDKSCILPVVLEPGKSYRLGINSLSHINFQSRWGVPLAPVEYRFETKAAQ
jgi:beta-lactamase regulating signal transducer with metallopeptidase domain